MKNTQTQEIVVLPGTQPGCGEFLQIDALVLSDLCQLLVTSLREKEICEYPEADAADIRKTLKAAEGYVC